MEKDDLIQWAREQQTTIHIGELLGICSIKNSEQIAEDLRRWKGRVCFRAPATRDQGGAVALFQEMSSQPTTIVDSNVSISYGALPGHKSTVADAIRAYVQSDLEAEHPTYVEFPPHLVPARLRHLRRPVCKLVKALYGHPTSGGRWERHLRRIIEKLGGEKVPGHPSVFWFPGTRLLLIVYVDDVLLSGPADQHEPFWVRFAEDVTIEPPEDLDRYLGRSHAFTPMARLSEDLRAQFKSKTPA